MAENSEASVALYVALEAFGSIDTDLSLSLPMGCKSKEQSSAKALKKCESICVVHFLFGLFLF